MQEELIVNLDNQKELRENGMNTVLLASDFPLVDILTGIKNRKRRQVIG